jgi:hypothetical protein
MKKTILILFALFCCGISFSQNFNYQAVVRDASNNPVTNQSVGVLVRIIEGSPTGSVVYNETHTVTSNAQGVITLPVGGGNSGANFQAINWSSQNQWIDIQVDITGGTSYMQIGTSKLQFVPYAMYALNSGEAGNAGIFAKSGNVVSNGNGNNATDDFVFGNSSLDDTAQGSILNSRFFFDKSKSAFRAGYADSNRWDEANVGDFSVGFGEGGTASGRNSFSMGRNANATGAEGIAFGTNAGAFGNYSRGFGLNARANGENATAIGRQLNANSLAEIQLGQYSKFVSGSADTWVDTDRLFVIGNGQPDINLALNSDALVMLKNGNTTLNGQLTLDGDNEGAGRAFTFPAQDGTAFQIMQTDGAGNVSWVTPAASAIPNGGTNGFVLSTDGSGVLSWVTNDDLDADPTNEIELPEQTGEDGKFLRTDGTVVSWQDVPNELPTGGTADQILSTDGSGVYSWVDQNAAPALSTDTATNITSNGSETYGLNDFIFGAPTNETGFDVSAANRIFFDKSKAAIRIGRDIGFQDAFADANVGAYSAAFGLNPKAAGTQAFAVGFLPNASGTDAIALGNEVNATSTSSVAIGRSSTASGVNSMTFGANLTSETYGQTTFGYYNTNVTGNTNAPVNTDRLFVIGNGGVTPEFMVERSDALVMLKNGNTTLNGTLTIDGDNQEMGASYTLPAQDGTANQVMTTDGSGNVSWANASGGTTLPAGGTNGQILSTDGAGNYSWVNDATGTSAFSTTANVTSNANGDTVNDDFLFGSPQVASVSGADDDNRIFFDKSRGAFRAGLVSGSQWDEVNTGFQSAAFGSNNIASGSSTFAAGVSNVVAGYAASALGDNNTVGGNYAFAQGLRLTSESFNQFTIGQWNTAHGGTPDASGWISTDRLFVIGNGTSGSSRSDALVMFKNGNTTLNGQLTIDGDNTGSGASYTLPAQDGTANQVMTTDGSGNVSWAAAASGGAFTTTTNVTSNANGTIATDDFVFGSTQLDNDTNTTNDDNRMFFNKSKGAFRAGHAESIDWDNSNVGTNSIALGYRSIARGNTAIGIGRFANALSDESVAIGHAASISDALRGIAIGYRAASGSKEQITIGSHNTIVTGDANNWVATDRLFVVGNGDADSTGGSNSSRSDALVMLKNGNTTLNGTLTIDGDNVGGSSGYTLPGQDGTANQILTTDGSGNVSWATAAADGDSDPMNEIELPSQTGEAGKFLTTDGTNPSWTNSVEATSVKIPSLPAFNVTSNGATYTSAGAKEVGNWNSTVNGDLFNDGTHLNLTNGRFTAPVDGLYFFSAQVRIDGINPNATVDGTVYSRLMIVKNGNAQFFRNGLHSIRNADAGTAFYDTQSVSGILKLEAGDYVSVFVESTGDTSFTVQSESGFNGYLVNKL